jgi:hypothetical protein
MLSKGIVLRRLVMAQPREAANSAAKAQFSQARKGKGAARFSCAQQSNGIVA